MGLTLKCPVSCSWCAEVEEEEAVAGETTGGVMGGPADVVFHRSLELFRGSSQPRHAFDLA